MYEKQTVKEEDKEITLTDDERQPCEVWTRVMGYHRPVSSFNIGKQGEFQERQYFKESVGQTVCPSDDPDCED